MENFKVPSIPTPKPNDPEDVSWALSTAEAMWGRGDHAEAIKWIRRGAEAASEAEADDRALELAKAAADLASMIVRMSQPDPSSARPQLPPPGTGGSSRAPPAAHVLAAGRDIGSVAPAPLTARSAPPPALAPPRGVSPSVLPPRPASQLPPAGAGAGDKSPRPLQAARGPERGLSTNRGVLSPRIETKRRRSSANLDDEARAASAATSAGASTSTSTTKADRAERASRADRERAEREEARRTHADEASARDPSTGEEAGTQSDDEREQHAPVTTDELGRTTEHDSMAAAISTMANEMPSADEGRAMRKKGRKSRTNEARGAGAAERGEAPPASRVSGGRGSVTDEWDAQQTQSLSRAELDSITNEHSLPRGMNAAKDLLPPLETSPHGQLPDPLDSEPGSQLAATQAMRVLLWRDAEGVHVAAAGTVVSAIAVDAILVAMSPSVDLSAWLDPGRGLMSSRAAERRTEATSQHNPEAAGEAAPERDERAERDGRAERGERAERSERAERNEKARGKLPK